MDVVLLTVFRLLISCMLSLCANVENPICIGHPFHQSTSWDTATFSWSVRSRLRHWPLILRILRSWRIKSRLRYRLPILRIMHIWRMKSRLRYRLLILRIFHIWRFGNHCIWCRLSLQCPENLKSIFLCPCPDFNGRLPISYRDRRMCSPNSRLRRTSDAAILNRDSCMLSGQWEICVNSQ